MNNIINLLTDSERVRLYSEIDKIPGDKKEWDKVDVLVKSGSYLDFLAKATGKNDATIINALRDYQHDADFQREFLPNLIELGAMPNAGDLRFHAITLYVVVRCLMPTHVIETGVAQGKSSATLLLALHHNKKGTLHSIDLPNPKGEKLGDGAFTTTGTREVGWVVPDYLRKRWELILGDSKIDLPRLLGALKENVDIFFHDSLHTYEHVKFELDTVSTKMNGGLIIVDNLETEAGEYFTDYSTSRKAKSWAFSNLGIIRQSPV